MALTLAEQSSNVIGNKRIKVFTVTFDTSYPTAGESLTAGDVGLSNIEILVVTPSASTTTSYYGAYDYSGELLQMFEAGADDNPFDEVADTTDLSALADVRIWVYGH